MPRLLATDGDDSARRVSGADNDVIRSRRAMEVVARPELSMSVKSLELPAYDPRAAKICGLAYVTANRGGDHAPN